MPQPINEVRISGRLTKDAEIINFKTFQGGTGRAAKFCLAFGYWKGKEIKPAWYFNCVAFGPIVDKMAQLTKGTNILITRGYLKHNTYKKKDGTTVRENIIIVEDYMLLKFKTETAEKLEQEVEMAEDISF